MTILGAGRGGASCMRATNSFSAGVASRHVASSSSDISSTCRTCDRSALEAVSWCTAGHGVHRWGAVCTLKSPRVAVDPAKKSRLPRRRSRLAAWRGVVVSPEWHGGRGVAVEAWRCSADSRMQAFAR